MDINFHLNKEEIEQVLISNGYEIEDVYIKKDCVYTHGSDKDYLESDKIARVAYKKGERPDWLDNPDLDGIDCRYEFTYVAKKIIIDKLMGLFCE